MNLMVVELEKFTSKSKIVPNKDLPKTKASGETFSGFYQKE